MSKSWLLALAFLLPVRLADACSLPHGDKPLLASKLAAQGKATGGYQVGAGVSGAWYDAARNGEGIILQITPNGRAGFGHRTVTSAPLLRNDLARSCPKVARRQL